VIIKIKKLCNNLLSFKFVKDSIYSLTSFVILSLSGIIGNIIIGNFYGAEGLGVFNQSIAIYMVLSILSIFGFNISVLKFVSQYNGIIEIQKQIFSSAFLLSLIFSTIIITIIFIIVNIHNAIFFNYEVTKAVKITILSLPFITLNKIFLALINAIRHIKIYSLIQSIRWILIILFVLISIYFSKSIYFVMYSFLFSEIILFTFFIIRYNVYLNINFNRNKWLKTNIIFGSKSVLLTFLSDFSNKIDIFFLGFFLSNYYVGIYSFASSIVVGFLSLSSVVQLNINPIISDLWHKKNISSIQNYTSRIAKIMFRAMTAILLIAAILYPFFIDIFMKGVIYKESIPIFYILLAGVFLPSITYFAGAYFAMANLLNVSFIIQIARVVFNVIACYVFIKLLGFYGAAIATSSTFVFSVIIIEIVMRRKMKIKILTFSNFF